MASPLCVLYLAISPMKKQIILPNLVTSSCWDTIYWWRQLPMGVKMNKEIHAKITYIYQAKSRCGLIFLPGRNMLVAKFTIIYYFHFGIYQYLLKAAVFLTGANAIFFFIPKNKVKLLFIIIPLQLILKMVLLLLESPAKLKTSSYV